MDSESLSVLQQAAAQAEGLPVRFSDRLRGGSYSELCRDARQALKDFGLATPQPRTPTGQFASFNDAVRAAAGHTVPPDEPPAVGNLGIGVGAAATPRQVQGPGMTSLIRGAAHARRSTAYLFAEEDQAGG